MGADCLDQLQEASYMQNLIFLCISMCQNLEHLFSLTMARSLVQLRTLIVEECGSIKEISVIREAREEESPKETILFSKLERLELHSLSNLGSCSGAKHLAIQCPSLKILRISQCPKLKTLHQRSTNEFEQGQEHLFNEKVHFPFCFNWSFMCKLYVKWLCGSSYRYSVKCFSLSNNFMLTCYLIISFSLCSSKM